MKVDTILPSSMAGGGGMCHVIRYTSGGGRRGEGGGRAGGRGRD